MYTYTPTSKFLVLAPIEAGPRSITPADQPQFDTNAAASRERSNSQSSTATLGSQVGEAVSPLPQAFLYLGMDQRK